MSNRVNIAYILNDTPVNSGATKAFMHILDGLTAFSINPFVVVPNRKGIYLELTRRGVPTLVVTYRPCAYPYCKTLKEKMLFPIRLGARLLVNRLAIRKLMDFLHENKINLVHSNTSVVRIGFDAASLSGIPHIYHIREYGDLDFGIHYFPRKKSFYCQLDKGDSYTICITKAIQAYYRQSGKTTSRVIYDGVVCNLESMPENGSCDFFLFAGRIQPAKGLDQLLAAYKAYVEQTDHPLHLKVAGSKGDIVYYEQQLLFVKKHTLGDYVHFLGEIDDITALMRDARAIIISSPNEGFGFCMPEAQQQGCLAIGRNSGGTREQLDNGLELSGEEIALRYDTTEQLTRLLTDVANRPLNDYDAFRKRAFRIVNRLYTQESNARQIYNFYKEILCNNVTANSFSQ